MTAADIGTVKSAIRDAVHGHIIHLRRSDQFHWRSSFLHRCGQTAQECAAKIQAALPGVTLLTASEQWFGADLQPPVHALKLRKEGNPRRPSNVPGGDESGSRRPRELERD